MYVVGNVGKKERKKEYREIPCLPSFPKMVTSYQTMAQYHSQAIDIGKVKIQTISRTPRMPFHTTSTSLFPLWSLTTLATINLHSISRILMFQDRHLSKFVQCVNFSDGLFKLNIIFWRFIHIVA